MSLLNRLLEPLSDNLMEDPFADGGEPRVTRRQRWMLYSFMGVFVSFILWAGIAPLDEVAKAQGRIVPSSLALRIMPEQPARVLSVETALGQTVKSGDLLLRMQPVMTQTDSATAEERYAALLAKQIRLQAEAAGSDEPVFPADLRAKAPDAVSGELNSFRSNKAKNIAQIETLKAQASQREQEVAQIRQQIKDLTNQAALARQEVGMLAPLVSEGAASKRDLLRAQQSLAATQSELNRLQKAEPTAVSALREFASRIAEQEATIQADARTQLSQLESEIRPVKAAVDASRGDLPPIEIRAPQPGKVQLMTVTTGSVVQPGQQQPMLEIVPNDGKLIVEARVKPVDIAYIRPGQPAMVKISAFDFSIYGGLDALVTDISPDTITDEKGETFYRVRLETKHTCYTDLKGNCRTGRKGEALVISTGMTAEVDIITGERTVLGYIMKPFIKASHSALTER